VDRATGHTDISPCRRRQGLRLHADLLASLHRPLHDGRVWLVNIAAERVFRGIALGRQAWLAGVLARIADEPVRRFDELLPWHWRKLTTGPPAMATWPTPRVRRR
jgi:hypothetical protein